MPTAVLDRDRGAYVIPAQHTDRLRAILAGKQRAPVPLAHIVQQVFACDYTAIYGIPAPQIIKLMTTDEKVPRLVLCANFRPEVPDSCWLGDRCKFVHADTRGADRFEVHINYAWTSPDAVTYERYPPGRLLRVAAPSSKTILDEMDSSWALRTKALCNPWRPLSHCAHYYLNRTCNLGSECQFIHAIYVDPEAKLHQRAPAPRQMGRVTRASAQAARHRQPNLPSSASVEGVGVAPVAMPPWYDEGACSLLHVGSLDVADGNSVGEDESYLGIAAPGLDATVDTFTLQRSGSGCSSESPAVLSATPGDEEMLREADGRSPTAVSTPASTGLESPTRLAATYRHNPYSVVEPLALTPTKRRLADP